MDESSAVIEMDVGVARLYVEGGEQDTLEDVERVFNEQLATMLEEIEPLKRMDYELMNEYMDGEEAIPRQSHGFS